MTEKSFRLLLYSPFSLILFYAKIIKALRSLTVKYKKKQKRPPGVDVWVANPPHPSPSSALPHSLSLSFVFPHSSSCLTRILPTLLLITPGSRKTVEFYIAVSKFYCNARERKGFSNWVSLWLTKQSEINLKLMLARACHEYWEVQV